MRRGIAIGLWVLAGLGFAARALFQGSAELNLASAVLLAASVAWTALIPMTGPPAQPRRLGLRLSVVAALSAPAISLTVIPDGDRRSFFFIAFVAVAALVLSFRLWPRQHND